jgi:hypothetical protein
MIETGYSRGIGQGAQKKAMEARHARAGIRTLTGLPPRDFKSEHLGEPHTTTVYCHRELAEPRSKIPSGIDGG